MTTQPKNSVAVVKKETIDIVEAKIKQFQDSGELHFPENYSPQNALKSAWLMLQETVDRNKTAALTVCTQASISNALLSMVIQGLNPDKKQCYFIVYGNKLQIQRSYFGSIHVAKSVDPTIKDIYGKTIYADDEFEYEIKHGKEIVTLHKQKLSNIDKDKIIGAYATILYEDGREISTIMTYEQIKQAWAQSQMKPIDDKGNVKAGSTHDKFTADMAEKTAINKVCKFIINGSSDKTIISRFAKAVDSEIQEAIVEEEIEEKANKQTIDIDDSEVIDAVFEDVEEPKQEDQEAKKKTEVKDIQQLNIDDNPGY